VREVAVEGPAARTKRRPATSHLPSATAAAMLRTEWYDVQACLGLPCKRILRECELIFGVLAKCARARIPLSVVTLRIRMDGANWKARMGW